MIGGNGYVSSRQGGVGEREREKAVAWNGPLLDRCVRVEFLWPGSVDLCA